MASNRHFIALETEDGAFVWVNINHVTVLEGTKLYLQGKSFYTLSSFGAERLRLHLEKVRKV